jgi:hypothetical protein
MNQDTNDRTADARAHDDHELIDEATRAPSGAGRSGGGIATDVGTRDEEKRATDPDAGITNVHKSDEPQPFIATRADNDGANG